jgi:hypothetical protein
LYGSSGFAGGLATRRLPLVTVNMIGGTTATIAVWAALLISGGPRAMLTVWPDMPWRGVQTVLKELPDDRAVNLVCKDASGQTWSTFADSGWGPDNLAEATAGAGQTSARGSRHESSRSTPSANECRFREQPRTTPAAPERTGRMPCSLPICGASKPECSWLTGNCTPCTMRGQNGLVRVVVTRIDPDGTLHRRMVDTAQQSDRQLWEDLAARAVGGPVPYRPAPGITVYHISVDDRVVIAAEHDLIGSLRDFVTAVMALGGELLEQSVSPTVASSLAFWPRAAVHVR